MNEAPGTGIDLALVATVAALAFNLWFVWRIVSFMGTVERRLQRLDDAADDAVKLLKKLSE